MNFTTPSITLQALSSPDTIAAGITTGKEISPFEANITPTKKVFDTTELFEQILDNLSVHDLLTAQSICRTTQSVIKGSIALQKRLFLRGADYSKRPKWDFRGRGGVIQAHSDSVYWIDVQSLPKTSLIVRPLILNTLVLSKNFGCTGVHWVEDQIVAINPPFDTHYPSHQRVGERISRKKSAVSSARYLEIYGTMFLTQPPATKAKVDIYKKPEHPRRAGSLAKAEDPRRLRWTTSTISNPDGVRWREILDEADRNKGEVVRVWFPDEVVVTPEVKEWFED